MGELVWNDELERQYQERERFLKELETAPLIREYDPSRRTERSFQLESMKTQMHQAIDDYCKRMRITPSMLDAYGVVSLLAEVAIDAR